MASVMTAATWPSQWRKGHGQRNDGSDMTSAMTKRAYADLRQDKMVGDLYGADSRRIEIQQRLVDEVLPEQ